MQVITSAHLWIHGGTHCAYICEFSINWPVSCCLFLSSLKRTPADTQSVTPPTSLQQWHTLAPQLMLLATSGLASYHNYNPNPVAFERRGGSQASENLLRLLTRQVTRLHIQLYTCAKHKIKIERKDSKKNKTKELKLKMRTSQQSNQQKAR